VVHEANEWQIASGWPNFVAIEGVMKYMFADQKIRVDARAIIFDQCTVWFKERGICRGCARRTCRLAASRLPEPVEHREERKLLFQ
jgi:hypothetical protein